MSHSSKKILLSLLAALLATIAALSVLSTPGAEAVPPDVNTRAGSGPIVRQWRKGADACTIAVAAGNSTVDGRPVIWKNRDYFERPEAWQSILFWHQAISQTFSISDTFRDRFNYVAVSDRGAWSDPQDVTETLFYPYAGANERGLAVVSAQAHTLEANVQEQVVITASQDASGIRNGGLNHWILSRCETITDVEQLLTDTNGGGGYNGSTARNTASLIAVIDRLGGAAIFEVDGNSFARQNITHTFEITTPRFPRSGPPAWGYNGFDYRSNFSRIAFTNTSICSGTVCFPYFPDKDQDGVNDLEDSESSQERWGRVAARMDDAPKDYQYFIQKWLRAGGHPRENYLEIVARSVGYAPYLSDFDWTQKKLVGNHLNRFVTVSSVVIVGSRPGDQDGGRLTTMWVALGEPSVAIFVPVFPYAGKPPAALDDFFLSVNAKRRLVYDYETDAEGYPVDDIEVTSPYTRLRNAGHAIDLSALFGGNYYGEGGIQARNFAIEEQLFRVYSETLAYWRTLPITAITPLTLTAWQEYWVNWAIEEYVKSDPTVVVYEAETDLGHTSGQITTSNAITAWQFSQQGYLTRTVDLTGPTLIEVIARGKPDGGNWPRMRVWISGSQLVSLTEIGGETELDHTIVVSPAHETNKAKSVDADLDNVTSRFALYRYRTIYTGTAELRVEIISATVAATVDIDKVLLRTEPRSVEMYEAEKDWDIKSDAHLQIDEYSILLTDTVGYFDIHHFVWGEPLTIEVVAKGFSTSPDPVLSLTCDSQLAGTATLTTDYAVYAFRWDPGSEGQVACRVQPGNYKDVQVDKLLVKESRPVYTNTAPVGYFTVDATVNGPTMAITATALVSDPDGDAIASYFWDFGDRASTCSGNPVVTHTYPITARPSPLTLYATDRRGKTSILHADSNILYVATDGDDANDCSTVVHRCRTVQRAVDRATPGDEIRVAGGGYTDADTSSLGYVVALTKTLILMGGWNSDFTARNIISTPTTLDAVWAGRVIYIRGPITPTIDGFTIVRGNATGWGNRGGGLYSQDALLTVRHCKVYDSVASWTGVGFGGGLYLADSTAALVDTLVNENSASTVSYGFGGGLHLDNSTITVTGSLVVSNTASTGHDGYGGGFSLDNSTVSLVNVSRVWSNTASTAGDGWGGGLYLGNDSTATLTGTWVMVNMASTGANGKGYGGGLYLSDSTANLSGGTLVRGNTAGVSGDGYGGGLALSSDSTANLSGATEVVVNDASIDGTGFGGGLYLDDSTANLSDDVVVWNNAASTANLQNGYGGGLYLENYAEATLTDTQVASNTASLRRDGYGGGLYLREYAMVNLNNTQVVSNTASAASSGGGGGLYLWEGSTANLSSSQVVNNAASASDNSGDGGGIYLYGWCAVNLTDTLVMSNTASVAGEGGVGGGIYLHQSIGNLKGATVVRGNTAAQAGDGYGGGLYVGWATANLDATVVQANAASSAAGSIGYGGGLYVNAFSTANLNGARIMGNTANTAGAGYGGGLYAPPALAISTRTANSVVAYNAPEGLFVEEGDHTVVNCSLSDNSLTGARVNGGALILTNTIVANHDVGIHRIGGAVVAGYTLFSNTINTIGSMTNNDPVYGDPRFVDVTAGDYHIQAGSAAIERGDPAGTTAAGGPAPTTDFDGEGRPVGARVDIGADEFPAGMSVTKHADPDPAPSGALLTFTLRVTNTGYVTLTAIITDILPDHAMPSGTLAWATAIAAPGGVWTKMVTVAVEMGYTGPLTNVVWVTTSEGAVGAYTRTVIAAPIVSLNPTTYGVEEDAGAAVITATLNTPAGFTSTVNYATSDGTAAAGSDYAAVSGTLTFSPGATVLTFTVPITDDDLYENDETFILALSSPVNAVTGSGNAVGIIWDDDPPPMAAFISATYTVSECANLALITVTLSGSTALTATVNYGMSDGTAAAGSDYAAVSGTLTFSPGTMVLTFTVPITDDDLHENDETIHLMLSHPTSATLGTFSATLTITDDDPPPPVPNFSAAPRSGDRPLLVTFTDLSTGSITLWAWRFGDGATSATANPTHTYTQTGVFTVSLQVAGPGGSSTLTRTRYITVTEPAGPVSYTLTIAAAGNGYGMVTPPVGAHEYLSGTTAVVTATAQPGSAFAGWSGAATGAANPASILMDADKVVTATFRALTYTLTVNIVGSGAVTRTPSQTTYLYNDVVTLTAAPAVGWYFGQWSGDASGPLTETHVTMNANKVVTATFVSAPPTYYTLTMHLMGSGVITPRMGAHVYLSGTLVNLSAKPSPSWQFAGWTGDLTGAENPTTLTMDGHKAITATFTHTGNQAPIANAGADQGVAPGVTVTLDGSASSDSDGDALVYFWRQTGGLIVDGGAWPVVSFTFTAPLTPTVLTFTLAVTDARGLPDQTPDEVAVAVNDSAITGLRAANSSPTTLGNVTLFTATASGSNIVYAWAFGDGAFGHGGTVSHTYTMADFYTAVVTASNGVGSVSAATPVTIIGHYRIYLPVMLKNQ